MVFEYKKLSDSLNESNLKNKCDGTNFQTIETDVLKTQLTELFAENEKLKATAQDAILENRRLFYVIRA